MSTATAPPSYSELMRLGRVHVMNQVPEQSRQSLPVPVRLQKELRVAFFYAPAQALPGVNRLAPPHFLAYLDATTGALISVAPVAPSHFNLPHEVNSLLGEFRLPQGMNAEQYLLERERLFGLYANLVPPWLDGAKPGAANLRLLGTEFLRSFGQVSEPPLMPYYHALGREFFDWVRAVARA